MKSLKFPANLRVTWTVVFYWKSNEKLHLFLSLELRMITQLYIRCIFSYIIRCIRLCIVTGYRHIFYDIQFNFPAFVSKKNASIS